MEGGVGGMPSKRTCLPGIVIVVVAGAGLLLECVYRLAVFKAQLDGSSAAVIS